MVYDMWSALAVFSSIIKSFNYFVFFSFAHYETVSIGESLYVLGGFQNGGNDSRLWRSSIIAQYKNEIWTNVGKLAESRTHSGVVTLGSTVMLIGGTRYVKISLLIFF